MTDVPLRHAASVLAPIAVVALPGKGRGITANGAIAAGSTLVRETAAIWCTHAARKALKSLDAKSARTFLAAVAGSESPDILQLAPVNLPASACEGTATALSYPSCVTSVVDRWLTISGAGPRSRVPAADVAAMDRAVALKLIMDANSFVANVRTAGCTEPPVAAASAGVPAATAGASAVAGAGARGVCAHPPPKQQCAAVALFTSMLNHSCLPNVAHVWSWDCTVGAPVVTVVAVRDIAAGEELCTRYIDVETRPRHSRKQTLRERYGFTCSCSRCTGKWDDAMTFRCPRVNGRCTLDADDAAAASGEPGGGSTASSPVASGCQGRVPGWSTACSVCGARYDDDADVVVDDRSALLAELLDDGKSGGGASGGDSSTSATAAGAAGSVLTTAPLLSALSEIAAAECDSGDAAAGGSAAAAAVDAAATASALPAASAPDGRFYAGPRQPVWDKLLQLLHPSDAALLPLLRSQAVVALVRHNDVATALALASAAHDALPHVPFLEPLSRLGLLVLYADICAVGGKAAAASAAYTEAAAVENGLCRPLHAAQENACTAASAGGDDAASGTQYGAELLRLASAPPTTAAELAAAQARRAGLKRTGGR